MHAVRSKNGKIIENHTKQSGERVLTFLHNFSFFLAFLGKDCIMNIFLLLFSHFSRFNLMHLNLHIFICNFVGLGIGDFDLKAIKWFFQNTYRVVIRKKTLQKMDFLPFLEPLSNLVKTFSSRRSESLLFQLVELKLVC